MNKYLVTCKYLISVPQGNSTNFSGNGPTLYRVSHHR